MIHRGTSWNKIEEFRRSRTFCEDRACKMAYLRRRRANFRINHLS